MKRFEFPEIDPRIWVLAICILAVSVSLFSLAEAKEPENEGILWKYGYYPAEQDKEITQVSFMNRSMMSSGSLTVPGNFKPPQCPYETWDKGLKLPVVGTLGVKLFCVPRDHDQNGPDAKAGKK